MSIQHQGVSPKPATPSETTDRIGVGQSMKAVFLDQQSLGLRSHLEKKGIRVRDVTEILGDTREGVPDEKIIDFLHNESTLILVTKDRGLARRAKEQKLTVIFVDETEVVANEVLRHLASDEI